jgi:hypothetical protein
MRKGLTLILGITLILGMFIVQYPETSVEAGVNDLPESNGFIPPHALNATPNGTAIPVDASILIFWNETMNWTAVNASFSYTDTVSTWNSTNGTWTHNSTTNSSTYSPTVQFEYMTQYWVTVNVTATDLAGNPLDQNMSGTGGEWPDDVLTWNFTTIMMPDLDPPLAIDQSPNGTSVPIDATISISWNETMNWTSVNASFDYTDGTVVYNSTNGTWVHNSTTNISTYTPTSPFDYNTQYWVNVNMTATDLVNNSLDQNQNGTGGEWPDDVLTWNFTSIQPPESITPIALNHSPNGTGVPINANIVVEWNETMNWASVNASFSYTDNATTWNSTNGTWTHNQTTNISTFEPTVPFEYETKYWVLVNVTATDFVGNPLDNNITWNFTTIDSPPIVVSTVPDNTEIDVNPEVNITIEFSEPMNTTSVGTAFSYTNGSVSYNATNGTVSWDIPNTIMTFNPLDALDNDTTYTVSINGSTAKDLNDNLLDGNNDSVVGDNYSWWFTTWAEPPPPKVEVTLPANGSTVVNIDTVIRISFDMEMNPVSVQDALSLTDGSVVLDEDDGAFSWSQGNSLMTFDLIANLAYNTEYTVRLLGSARSIHGSTLDGNGNDIGEGTPSDDYSFSFTTSLIPPTVISTEPTYGEIGVLINITTINITFDKAMDTSSVESSITISPALGNTKNWNSNHTQLTIQPVENLLFDRFYIISINADVATDTNGIWLDGNGDGIYGDDFQLRFSTEGAPDNLGPEITNVFPPSNSTRVPVNTFVGIAFSEPMNRSSVEQAFTMTNQTSIINGSFSWNFDSTSVNFLPVSNLSHNTTYTVTVGTGVKDTVGNMMESTYSWSFTTAEKAEDSEPIPAIWLFITVILFLLLVVGFMFVKNKSLRTQLRKARVENRKLKKRMKGAQTEEIKEPRVEPEEVGPDKVDKEAGEDVEDKISGGEEALEQPDTPAVEEDIKKED